MNLNKYIKILLIELSNKYDISIVNVMKVNDERIHNSYIVNYRAKKDDSHSKSEHFSSKQSLVSWLMWLEK